jgi:hypothetical protein
MVQQSNGQQVIRRHVFIAAMILVLLSALPSAAVAASPTAPGHLAGPKAPPTAVPGQEFSYTSEAQSSKSESVQPANADTSCIGASYAYDFGSSSGIYGNGYLECSGLTVTYMGLELDLFRCYWGGTTYCGSMDNLGEMGETCQMSSAGTLWCPGPGEGSYYYASAANGCYMVQGFTGLIDADGFHGGSDSSQIICH